MDTNTASGLSPAIPCAACDARCCRLEVLPMGNDNVPIQLTAEGCVEERLDFYGRPHSPPAASFTP